MPADENTPIGTCVKVRKEFFIKYPNAIKDIALGYWYNRDAYIFSNDMKCQEGFTIIDDVGVKGFWHSDWVILS